VPGLPASGTGKLFAFLPQPLTRKTGLQKSKKIRDKIGNRTKIDVMGGYEVACDIRELRDAAKYGANAMGQFANFVGWSLTTVNDYATLAETWPNADEFAKIAAKKNKNGIPLTWTHFIVLMREPNEERRQILMRDALNKGWTVAALEKARGEESDGSDSNGRVHTPEAHCTDGGDTRPAEPLKIMVNDVAEKLTALKTKWEKEILTEIAKVPTDQLETTLSFLQESRKQVAELHKTTLDSIDLAIRQVEESLSLAAKKQAANRDVAKTRCAHEAA
jgi:hypothetical protein